MTRYSVRKTKDDKWVIVDNDTGQTDTFEHTREENARIAAAMRNKKHETNGHVREERFGDEVI